MLVAYFVVEKLMHENSMIHAIDENIWNFNGIVIFI